MAAGTARSGSGTADRILDAALSSFGTRGYEATSLDALAGSLDIAKQTILYWFPSKDALLVALIDRSAAELAEAMQAALDGAVTVGSASKPSFAPSSGSPPAARSSSGSSARSPGSGRRRRRR